MPFVHLTLTKTVYIITVNKIAWVRENKTMMTAVIAGRFRETTPLLGGSYKVTYFRNELGACNKEDATEEIVHFYNMENVLVHCEYHKIKKNK